MRHGRLTRAAVEAVLVGEVTSHTHPAGGGGLNESQVQALIDASILAARQADHPVGSYYVSDLSTAPATVFGFGTWARVQGKFLVGASDSDPDFDAGDEAGAKTVTLTEAQIPSHTHVQNSHTHVQDAHTHVQNSHNHTQDAHTHVITSQTATTGSATSYEHGTLDTSSAEAEATEVTGSTTATNQAATAVNQNATATNQAATAVNQSTGGGGAHDNLPPYRAAYIWRRTA